VEAPPAAPSSSAGPSRTPSDPSRAAEWIPLDAGLAGGDTSSDTAEKPGATEACEEPIDLASVPAGDLYLLADHELRRDHHENAAELFRWAIERMPEMVLAHMGLGIALVRMGNPAEAIEALERCVELQPDLSEAHNNLGIAYHLAGQSDDARRALQRAIDLDPGNAEARANLDEVDTRVEPPNPLGAFTAGS
jgi:Tfp pilus assembly protein PilF